MSAAKNNPTPRPHGDEQSAIRDKAMPSRRVSSPEISTPRELRLAEKMARAEALLAELDPGDSRARLLHVAMLRQDEALVDGILATLERPETFTAK
ncbi:MAG TPA: hypothetical protein VIM73_20485 [Polyangiaceae bacterium]